jgi:hypothetical protein
MAIKKKTVYTAQYTVEVKIVADVKDGGRITQLHSNLADAEVVLTSSTRNFPQSEYQAGHSPFDYTEKYFPEAVRKLYFQMHDLENIARMGIGSPEPDKRIRNAVIRYIKKSLESDLRKRLPTSRGAMPAKYRDEDRGRFIAEICEVTLSLFDESGSVPSKSNVARRYYGNDGNSLRDLNRELKKYEITFEEMKEFVFLESKLD